MVLAGFLRLLIAQLAEVLRAVNLPTNVLAVELLDPFEQSIARLAEVRLSLFKLFHCGQSAPQLLNMVSYFDLSTVLQERLGGFYPVSVYKTYFA